MAKPELLKIPARAVAESLVAEQSEGLAVYRRELLLAGDIIEGEALIVEQVATTHLAPNWRCEVDERGNMILTLNQ